MLENCLRHKIIRDFLKHYTENRWKDLIPSLIEIGILNLQQSFNKIFFTNEELRKILRHLQISQIEKDKEKNREKEKDNKEYLIEQNINKDNEKNFDIKNNINRNEFERNDKNMLFKSQSKTNEIQNTNINGGGYNNDYIYNINNTNNYSQRMQIVDIKSFNQDKNDKFKSYYEAMIEVKNNIKNNYHYFKNNISNEFKNKIIRQKGEYYKKINIEKNKNNHKKKVDKISYAISYDKDLRPANISKKINQTQNNTNIVKSENMENNNFNLRYSSEKKSKNKSKTKYKKNINKDKYLNINLNNLNRVNNVQNIKKKQYYYGQQNNNYLPNTGKEKKSFFKKINIIQNNELTNTEINNNYNIIKDDKSLVNHKSKRIINNNSSSNNNTCNNYRNLNFINTLYQRVNSNGQAIKINNDNYFSNRDELNEFIRKNRIKLNIKQDSNYRNNITKSEKPVNRKNNFLNIDEKEKEKFNNIKISNKNSQNLIDKNNSINKIFNKEENINIDLIKSYPNYKDLKLNKSTPKTPKKNTINSDNNTITISSYSKKRELNNNNDIKEDNNVEIKNKSEDGNKKNNKSIIKNIKLFDLNKEKNEQKNNKKNNNFEKANGKNGECRYFNVFGCEGEEISLTQIEKEYSGMIDSSTSNEMQMNPDYFFKETPKNVFKINKSNEYSINSNNTNNNESK